MVYIYIIFFLWCFGPIASHGLSLHGLAITLPGHTTHGQTPLDEWSVRYRDLYLAKHYTHKRQTSTPRRDSNPQSQQAKGPDPRLRLRCHWDRLYIYIYIYMCVCVNLFIYCVYIYIYKLFGRLCMRSNGYDLPIVLSLYALHRSNTRKPEIVNRDINACRTSDKWNARTCRGSLFYLSSLKEIPMWNSFTGKGNNRTEVVWQYFW